MHLGKLIRVVHAPPWAPAPNGLRGGRRYPIGAWRAWCYEDDRLRSIVVNRVWHGPAVWDVEPPVAYPGTEPPEWMRVRGFHAYNHHAWALRSFVVTMKMLKSVDAAIGSCELYGRVCVYECGYRAQGAVIRKLWIPNAWGKVARRAILERTYACEVRYIPSVSPVGATR